MHRPSRQVSSSQSGPHPGLARRVRRQARSRWRKPPQAVDRDALLRIDAALATHRGPLVLDSFCGTGLSTAMLARRHPESLVIGVDQSAHRLGKGEAAPDNALLLRAHCEAVWRHLVEHGQRLESHYLLYPNPWPKPAQLRRRVHGHPAFALLPRLGGTLELRSNWQVYVEEFGMALHLLHVPSRVGVVPADAEPSSRFEHKYAASGHTLWRLTARMPGPAVTMEKTMHAHE